MSGCSLGLMPWLKRKIVDPFLQILRRGAEPKQLAFSTALGLTLGIFPIVGVTFFLCGFAIALFGKHCHAPSILLANFVATPIELSLVVPFLRLGEFITGGSHFPLTSDAFKKVITGHASHELLLSIVHALLGWIIAAPIILAVLYFVFVPTFKYLIQKFSSSPSSPEKQSLLQPDPQLFKSRVSPSLEAEIINLESQVDGLAGGMEMKISILLPDEQSTNDEQSAINECNQIHVQGKDVLMSSFNLLSSSSKCNTKAPIANLIVQV